MGIASWTFSFMVEEIPNGRDGPCLRMERATTAFFAGLCNACDERRSGQDTRNARTEKSRRTRRDAREESRPRNNSDRAFIKDTKVLFAGDAVVRETEKEDPFGSRQQCGKPAVERAYCRGALCCRASAVIGCRDRCLCSRRTIAAHVRGEGDRCAYGMCCLFFSAICGRSIVKVKDSAVVIRSADA